LKDIVDFAGSAHPGTAGSFVIVADGFVLANGAPDEAATKDCCVLLAAKRRRSLQSV
jgi:glucose/mannose transport system substrate-binding protein